MKTYCVHFNAEYKYENIKAKNRTQALRIAREKHEAGTVSEDFMEEIVMIQCQICRLDNDTDNKLCDECNKKL